MNRVMEIRRAGVLLHPTSLPGPQPIGTLGAHAWRFVDWLAAGGFSVWQTLPLGPADAHGSPYCVRSAFAGDIRLLDTAHLASLRQLPAGMDLSAVGRAPAETYAAFVAGANEAQREGFAGFARRHRSWLFPFGLFELCTRRFDGNPWWLWPREFRERRLPALLTLLAEHRQQFRAALFEQYLFELQWAALKRYAAGRGVHIFGDLPFYMDLNSVEVWWDRELFQVGADGRPIAVAGVPPDYFNADGQLWGNPLYDWDAMERAGFDWWVARVRAQLHRFDLIRIDHFRALESYWEVPAGAKTAREGEWRKAPGAKLLATLRNELGEVALVAEDLGMITDDVLKLRDQFDLPGMVVLQFAFDGTTDNTHLPAHHKRNAVVYTGTHDNDTTVGWYATLDPQAQAQAREELSFAEPSQAPAALIDAAYASNAALAVIPMQDLLALDSSSRMNAPGTTAGNWSWRFAWDQVDPSLPAISRARAERTGRLP